MNAWIRAGLRAAVSGTLASLAMTAALSALARQEHRGALQPINATSHWLHGERAGAVAQADAAHTAVGYATHHASAWFWALLFERWLLAHPPRTALALIKDAAAMSAVAAVVDYALVPKRLTAKPIRPALRSPTRTNRTCRSPASGSPTGFTVRHTGNRPTARGFSTVSTLLRPSTQQSHQHE
jgi:hypothetical protein